MRRDLELSERHLSPGMKHFMHRCGWIIQLVTSIGFLGLGVAVFFEMIPKNPIVAVAAPVFCWAAAWFLFTLALRTRARRLQDYPNEM